MSLHKSLSLSLTLSLSPSLSISLSLSADVWKRARVTDNLLLVGYSNVDDVGLRYKKRRLRTGDGVVPCLVANRATLP